jgi:hypothetical protein
MRRCGALLSLAVNAPLATKIVKPAMEWYGALLSLAVNAPLATKIVNPAEGAVLFSL